jgi:two-component system sensor kinase FixL
MQISLNSKMSVGIFVDLLDQQWLRDNAASVLDAVVDSIVAIDVAGTIQSFNLATQSLFGYQSQELLGQPVSILMPEPFKSEHDVFVRRFIESNEAKIIGIGRELSAVRKDGSEFPIYLAINEINAPNGRYFVGIIRDLTEQKAAHDALLEQKDRSAQVGRLITMGEMTASIAHEVNQPLTAIAMYAQACIRLLDKGDPDIAKIGGILEKLTDQSLRAGEVIERIQRFVQNKGSQRETVDINTLLRDITRLAAGDALLHGIELEFELDPGCPQAACDSVQIQQVVLNLVRNAIDAMFAVGCKYGNRIRVVSLQEDESVIVKIEDSGPGIASEQAPLLFKPFQSTKRDGMGMGLAICKTIIEDHDGSLGFENRPEGRGACFYFQLPRGVNCD